MLSVLYLFLHFFHHEYCTRSHFKVSKPNATGLATRSHVSMIIVWDLCLFLFKKQLQFFSRLLSKFMFLVLSYFGLLLNRFTLFWFHELGPKWISKWSCLPFYFVHGHAYVIMTIFYTCFTLLPCCRFAIYVNLKMLSFLFVHMS